MGNKPILPQAFVYVPIEETTGQYFIELEMDTFDVETIVRELELYYADVLDRHFEPIIAAVRYIDTTNKDKFKRHTRTYVFDNSKYKILKITVRCAEILSPQSHYEPYYHHKCYLHLLKGDPHSGYVLR